MTRTRRGELCPEIKCLAADFHVSAYQSGAARLLSRGANKNPSDLIERVLRGDLAFPAARVRCRSMDGVTWIIGES